MDPRLRAESGKEGRHAGARALSEFAVNVRPLFDGASPLIVDALSIPPSILRPREARCGAIERGADGSETNSAALSDPFTTRA